MSIFSEQLKLLRKNKNVTQKQIAKEIGMVERAYQRLEAGHNPNFDNLISLADYFEVSIDYLVGRTDNPQINK